MPADPLQGRLRLEESTTSLGGYAELIDEPGTAAHGKA
jgi:hypothetical protein